ncbi:MAG: RluA family pseudouridine synthase [Candidatus Krumholzibacteriia bacterium]
MTKNPRRNDRESDPCDEEIADDGDPTGDPVFRLTAGPDDEGLRLDAFIVERVPEFSRTRIHTELEAGRVTVGGRLRPKGFRLRPGDEIVFAPAARPELQALPQDLPLAVVHRDDHILVLDKAVGMVVHPAPGHPDGTLVNALLHHLGDLSCGAHPLRPGIVHRLDRDTSGLMVVALTEQAHHHLAAQLQDRRLGRTYQAIAWGRWPEARGTLTGDIGRHPRLRQQMAVVERGGRPAVTHYEVVEDFGFVQHCRVRLETGRTHQIRVHFAHNHHPVVGDAVYGDDKRVKGMHGLDRPRAEAMLKQAGRQMLHAAALRLEHPGDGRILEFAAPPPADMQQVLDTLRAGHPA